MPRSEISIGVQRPAHDVFDHLVNSETTNLNRITHFLALVGAVFLLAAVVLALICVVRSDLARSLLLRSP
jgi:hypothetical protein